MRRIASMVAVVVAMIMVSAVAAGAQVPGQAYCGDWDRFWSISEGWWYVWWYKLCYNPSIEGAWYIEWDGWEWWAPVA